MRDPINELLSDDHQSLGQLLTDIDESLATHDLASAFDLLDRFWARLAVHIRAEHLQLFPELARAPAAQLTGRDGLPTPAVLRKLLARLRSDHDFFMKELARLIGTMRQLNGNATDGVETAADLRRRLQTIKERLEEHNQIEEKQVYVWPASLLDATDRSNLRDRLQHEISNLPPRLTRST